MFKYYNIEEVSKFITVYNGSDVVVDTIETNELDSFFANPTHDNLISILMNNTISKNTKQAILASLNSSLNYTSVSGFLKNKKILEHMIKALPIKLIYTKEQSLGIISYINRKSSNTGLFSAAQVRDIKSFFNTTDIPNFISNSGACDYRWHQEEAGADGVLWKDDPREVLIYARYGTGGGGSQNDRWRGMFSTSTKHPNRRFLFICDGPEVLIQYKLGLNIIKNNMVFDNALWCTTKMLPLIDWEHFKLTKP